MDAQQIFLLQPSLDVLAAFAALWVYVETLNGGEDGLRRAGRAAGATAVLVWSSALVAGYLHVTVYGAARQAGDSWSDTHGYVIAVHEHLFFTLLLLATCLPIAVRGSRLMINRGARRLVLVLSASIAVTGLGLEAFGALVDLETRMALVRTLAG